MAVGNINLSRVNISLACKDKVCDIYKKRPLDDVGPDDFFVYGVPMQILAMDKDI